MLKSYSHHKNFDQKLEHWIQTKTFLKHIKVSKEFYLLCLFGFLFFILLLRLFYLQILQHNHYDTLLNQQHVSETSLKAKRGNIFADDKAEKHIQLTDNISMYNIFVDPKFIWDKERFIALITPVVYQHFCELYGMKEVTQLECIHNIEQFTQTQIIPPKPQFFYYGSGIISSGFLLYDHTGYNNQLQQILSGFTPDIATSLIKTRLNQMIYIGIKPKNYLGFFANTNFLAEIAQLNLDYVDIQSKNYIYIIPDKVGTINKDIIPLKKILDKYGYLNNFPNLEKIFSKQENRYVKIISDANPLIAQQIKSLKNTYYQTRSKDRIPLLHGLGMESYTKRYYQYGSFLANVMGFVDKSNNAYYGVEQYFDTQLRGKDGKIVGRASAWIGPVGANEFEIEQVQDGNDIYLTIDIGIQKEAESIIKKYHDTLQDDSISVLVYDPFNGQVKASANYPSYNPNNYNDAFSLKALGPEYGFLVDDLTYIENPVYIQTGGEYRIATSYERIDTTLEKYIAKNMFGPQVLVDKNTAMAYEPGSVFKAFTVAIGLDTDEIRFYDPYNDPGKVKVGQFTIKNAETVCMGDWNFLHAFVWSCNVGMVRIAQKMGKEIFYNYLDKLAFGKITGIEVANEDAGFVEGVTSVSDARFFNNTFGQGLLVTPIQLAAGYGSIVNGGYYVKPTIIKGIFDRKADIYYPNTTKITKQIFRPETAEALKVGLFSVLDQNPELRYAKVEGYQLGGKSGTSQISYKGKYMNGVGWTNASFVGVITKDDPKYIIVVQVRRPRQNIWGSATAGKIFGEMANFIINYALIEK
ncbi:MAG TPA: penicillin-binding protein 2 [Candidatus Absconditabacterales bacterium]|nr:penicillin-binding protein 2 [Candidatus Absconditabacterales bacterium]